jgi:hypothetical protein
MLPSRLCIPASSDTPLKPAPKAILILPPATECGIPDSDIFILTILILYATEMTRYDIRAQEPQCWCIFEPSALLGRLGIIDSNGNYRR